MKSVDNKNKYAFMVLKPDALRRFLDINIIQKLPKKKLEIVKQKMLKMTEKQAATIYAEKLQENYYPLLEKFLVENPSICLILKSTEGTIKKSQEFKDEIRKKFKIFNFEVADKDLELLKAGRHPKQEEITRAMALENLIHAANNFREVYESTNSIFSEEEIQEIKELEPELYQLFLEYRRETEKNKEIILKRR